MADTETIPVADLERLVADVFVRRGMTLADACEVADVLVWAEASDHRSHGISRIERYLDFIARGDLDPAATPCLDKDAGALFRIDGKRAAGAVAMREAVSLASARAKLHGIAMGLVARTTHIGSAGCHALRLAGSDRIAIVAAGGVPLMAYHGAATPSLPTAPLAIAVPAAGRPPLLLDMASSHVAMGKVKQAIRQGRSIPEGWALTADGRPATDPNEATALLPLGGAKGSGLALMIECLTGVLAGAPALLGQLGSGRSAHTQNAMVIAIEIGSICALDPFRTEVSDLARALEALPKADGVAEILMPGARSARARAAAGDHGITVKSATLADLKRLGAVD